MAQRIVVDCDVHGARDESAEGAAYDVVVRRQGEAFVFVTVDLCEVCAKPLTDLVTELAEIGRPFDHQSAVVLGETAAKPRKRAASLSRAVTIDTRPTPRPKTADGESTTCPACGAVLRNRGGLFKHCRRRHGHTLRELLDGAEPVVVEPSAEPTGTEPKAATDAPAEKFVCPTCGDWFNRAASMGAHRARKHGYRTGADEQPGEAHADE